MTVTSRHYFDFNRQSIIIANITEEEFSTKNVGLEIVNGCQ